MGAPFGHVLGYRRDDFRVEVKSQVVARSPVGQPVVANANLPTTLLFDDGVDHRMDRLQSGQVVDGGNPPIKPSIERSTAS